MPLQANIVGQLDSRTLERLEADRSLSDADWALVVAELARRSNWARGPLPPLQPAELSPVAPHGTAQQGSDKSAKRWKDMSSSELSAAAGSLMGCGCLSMIAPMWGCGCLSMIAIMAILVGGLATCSPEPQPATTLAKLVTAATPQITVTEFKLRRGDFGMASVVGSARNNTNRSFRYAQLEFNLYNAAGDQVGSTLANITNVDPHGTWRFSAPVFQDGAMSVGFKRATAF